jgi:hypothetical protein
MSDLCEREEYNMGDLFGEKNIIWVICVKGKNIYGGSVWKRRT